MKRLLVSAVFVSMAFVGIGNIAEKVAGSMRSDEKALEIIKRARTAIGGDGAIADVRSLVIKGQTSRTVNINGVERSEPGETEIVFQAPDRLMKKVTLGSPVAGEDAGQRQKVVDVVVVGDPAGGTRRVIVDGNEGEILGNSGERVHVKRADGTNGENAETRVFVRKTIDADAAAGAGADTREIISNDGKKFTIVRKAQSTEASRSAEDGKTITFERAHAAHPGPRDNELLRTMLSLLLTAPEGMDVSYAYAGETTMEGVAVNAVEAVFDGSAVKLYFDLSNGFPVGMSFVGHPAPVLIRMTRNNGETPAADAGEHVIFRGKVKGEAAEPTEQFVRFGDYRNVGGVMLPHKWTTSVGSRVTEVLDVTSYDINPADIADRFRSEKVMVRAKAADGNR